MRIHGFINAFAKTIFLFYLLLFNLLQINAQMTVEVVVNSGISTTTCTDLLSDPELAWSVDVANGGWVNYPELLSEVGISCFIDPPNTQYQQTFDCGDALPDSIEICFRAFDYDGLFCGENAECEEIICQNFPFPQSAGQFDYTLTLPGGLSSGGEVQFSIIATGGISANDFICDAIDLGTLGFEEILGDLNVSSYENFCGTNTNEPFSINNGDWTNDMGVWFSFTTGPNVSVSNNIILRSDPENLGSPIDIQVAVFTTDDGTCTGNLNLEYESYSFGPDFNQIANLNCLEPNTTYYILVDGSFQGISGYFGFEVESYGTLPGPDFRCDALDLGQVPDGGNVSVTKQANNCATNFGDPFNPTFGVGNGVWYSFIPPSTGHVQIEVISSLPFPQGIDIIDAEVAIFSSTNNSCNGFFIHEGSSFTPGDFDEFLEVECLRADRRYWVIVDGSTTNPLGVFDLIISDGGNPPPQSTIDTAICFGETFTVGTSTYDTTGSFIDYIPIPNSCDSVVFLNLVVGTELNIEAMQVSPNTSILLPNGEASALGIGGQMPYTYLWSNMETTATISGLPGGDYCVTVTDALGCTADTCITVLNQIMPPVVEGMGDTLDCFGDSDGVLTLEVITGDFPFAYVWESQNGTLNGAGVIDTLVTQELITGLPVGTYSITITDINLLSDTIELAIVQPTPLEVSLANSEDASCFGICDGSIAVAVQEATPPYTYNWSSSDTDSVATGLCAGDYFVTVTDANGCFTVFNAAISEPPEFIVEASAVSPVTCFGGNDGVAFATSNGNSVSFVWDNGETGDQADSLNAGNHMVTATNFDGCTDVATVFIEQAPAPLSLTIEELSSIRCFNQNQGELEAVASGGADGPYTFVWNDGNPKSTITSLFAGDYSVTVTDDFGCTEEASYTLTQPAEIMVSVIEEDATCLENGQIAVTSAIGGTGNLEFTLDGNNFKSDSIFFDLSPGDYELTVRDSLDCLNTFETAIFPPPEVTLELGEDEIIQLGEEVNIFAQTNIPNPILEWEPQDSMLCSTCVDVDLKPLDDVTYTVVATDSSTGCFAIDQIQIVVQKERNVFIPNIFSPNGDGANDFFTPVGGEDVLNINYLKVFDRWGNLVFETNNLTGQESDGWNGTWNGKDVSPGVYVFVSEIVFIDGEVIIFQGDVTVVR